MQPYAGPLTKATARQGFPLLERAPDRDNPMKRKSLDTATCPIARTLDVIGDWWSLLIVRDIFLGKRRYGELQKSLGLAKNILCSRLKKLVLEEVLETEPASDGTTYQEYVLTEKGRDLYLV